ncbi:RWP-RK domain [Plasmopara halstedii]|uniref:RWP-RK domain n=1 Tax=Plasmopara halstedii TaxID=4781 RepID=A0A0P1AXV6_PLAHL|nr:RWP-RK domain [Plasmopara halstedii]CEG46514.1 RWP-RK domain [Plasmopara halstedii]|eukprot:XP_024582883.1 RWP-RK domain [Plasmopara halstedii]
MTTTSFVRSGIHAVQLLISIDWHARDRQTSISRHRVAQRTDFLSSEGLIFGVELTFTHLLESCTLHCYDVDSKRRHTSQDYKMASTSADFDLSELQKYYHLPLREAARRLGSCEAVVKRVCRRKQIQRWPYRQVSSKLIKIQHLCKYMAHVSDTEQKSRIQQKIKQLTQEYLELVGGQVPSELQLTPAEVPTLPPPSYKGTSPIDPARLSAYSLRFILSDCTVLETDTGLQYSTTA